MNRSSGRRLRFERLEDRRVLATIGLMANDGTNSVTSFDADTDTVINNIPIPAGNARIIGDVEISNDGNLGFVTDFDDRVWVIDLTGPTPALATGINPIPISNNGEDLSTTPDGQYLVVSNGSSRQPLSVIDIATRTEVSTFDLFPQVDHNSVQVGSDGSVYATTVRQRTVGRMTIDANGQLTDTGERLRFFAQPNNVSISPDGAAGVVVLRRSNGDDTLVSFKSDGLTPVDTRDTSGFALAAVFNAEGDRVYVRTSEAVDVFSFDSSTGSLGAAPLLSIPVNFTPTFFGMDQLALSNDCSKLYVPQRANLAVFDAATGNLLTLITDPNRISVGTGIDITSAVNEPPEANDDAYSVDEDNVLTVNAPGVLANDSDPDGDPLTVSLDSGPSNGALALNGDGSFEYTPNADFNGTDSFVYIADDGNGGTDTATVTITVNSVIDALIDVKPGNGDEVDPINLGSKGRTPIAILATQTANGEADDFDPTLIDLALISFKINGEDISAAKLTLEDVDGDGDTDLLIHFLTQDLAEILTAEDTELHLSAEFGGDADGDDLAGSDQIKVVPKKGKKK